MPRRMKKVTSSGSALLGAELRRLRGTRSLEDIASLTKARPLAAGLAPVSASSLSEIELGRQLPRLPTLYALSLVYQVSMNQLMAYVVEDGIAIEASSLREDGGETLEKAFERLLSIGAWHRALPVALRGEKSAEDERSRIRWRGNRAICLARIGFHSEAVSLFTECLESTAITPRQEFTLIYSLADMHAAAGNFKTAARLTKDALEHLPADATPVERAVLQEMRAQLLVQLQVTSKEVDERALREALRLVESALPAWAGNKPTEMRLRFHQAQIMRLLGNRLIAERDLMALLEESSQAGFPRIEAKAALELAGIRSQTGQDAQSESLLLRCVSVAEASQQHDLHFEGLLALFRLLRRARPGAAVIYFHRCQGLLSVLPSQAPCVQEFRAIARELAS